jgi:hypothetical protein
MATFFSSSSFGSQMIDDAWRQRVFPIVDGNSNSDVSATKINLSISAPPVIPSGFFRSIPTPLILWIFTFLSSWELVDISLVCRKFHFEAETISRFLVQYISESHLRPGLIDEVAKIPPSLFPSTGHVVGPTSTVRYSYWKRILYRITARHDSILLFGGQGGPQHVMVFHPLHVVAQARSKCNSFASGPSSPSPNRANKETSKQSMNGLVWRNCASMIYPRQCFTAVWMRGNCVCVFRYIYFFILF